METARHPPIHATANERVDHEFSVPFRFPLCFTQGVFDPHNPMFADVVRRLEPHRRHRVLVIIDWEVAATNPTLEQEIATYFAAFPDALELVGAPVIVLGGEACKNDLAHSLALLRVFNDAGLDRQSFVAVIGGGAVLDMASFAASIAHRGIRTLRLPTTVLSQADSGVGVKTSMNLYGKKNFIGTFVPPFAVINDAQLLQSLSLRDRISGTSEALKVALLKDPAFVADIERHADGVAEGDLNVIGRLIRRSAELHLAHICGKGDPFELGSARPLDFGHWAAHKLESMTDHRIRHGEAVAVGMALDVTYSAKKGFLDRASAARIIKVIDAMGLPLWDDGLAERDRVGQPVLIAGLREFREHLGGELHITLLRGIGDGFEVTEMDEAVVVDSIDELAAFGAAGVSR